jgi:hypothetical protein
VWERGGYKRFREWFRNLGIPVILGLFMKGSRKSKELGCSALAWVEGSGVVRVGIFFFLIPFLLFSLARLLP